MVNNDSEVQILLLGLTLIGAGLIVWRLVRRKQAVRRPEWSKMMADTEYFSKAMRWVFKRRGFEVLGVAPLPVPYLEGPREVLFRLRKGRKIYAALCGRWVAVVGSDQVLKFQEQLSKSRDVHGAMLITTGKFTPSACDQAADTPLTLHNGEELQRWMMQ